jgi:hypothetical protein
MQLLWLEGSCNGLQVGCEAVASSVGYPIRQISSAVDGFSAAHGKQVGVVGGK